MQKNFIFISTLEHLPWGGCEDLWYKTALYALSEGNRVLALVFRHDIVPEHLNKLKQAGAKIFFLERPNQKSSLTKRLQRKILPAKIHQQVIHKAEAFFAEKNYTAVISQAGGFDFCYSYLDELAQWLLNSGMKYHVIVQNVPDLGFTVSLKAAAKQQTVFNKAQTVCFVSERNHISAERILAAHIPNARLVNNPLNVPLLNEPLPFPEIKDIVSFAEVAALRSFHKGQDILLQVLAGDEWKNRNWELNLYGEGPDKDYLKELAKFYQIENKIHFHGHVKDIREVWKVNHIHILPSLGEGTPLALIESMYCGRPAITTDVGGNAEYCVSGQCGFVCAYPTPSALREVIEEAWSKKERWKEMGKQSFEKINKVYDLNATKTLYEIVHG